jgi:CBS domain-containing protein
MHVNELMSREAKIIDPNTSIREVALQMRTDNIGALPVGENDRLIGMITDRDIVVRAVADERPAGKTTVRDVMSNRVFYCFDDDDVGQAARTMAEHQVRRLPVLNRSKRLVGMVAMADLGRKAFEAGITALKGVSERTSQSRR